jgi:hypothetical protein
LHNVFDSKKVAIAIGILVGIVVLNIQNSSLKITETLFLFLFNRWMLYQKGFSRKKGFVVNKMEGILIKWKLPNSNFKIQIKVKENFQIITSINLYNVIAVKQN